jgi:anti-sigma factor RsiW
MYDCSEIKRLIEPSLDRELDVKEALRVQSHLKDCAPCRELLLDEQDFLALLPAVLAPAPAPEFLRLAVTEALSQEVQRLNQTRRRWRALASPGMLLAVATLALFFVLIPRSQVPPLVKVALAEHRLYMHDASLLQVRSDDVQTVRRALEQRLPFPLHIPPKTVDDVRLVGADVTDGRNPAAVLAYMVDGAHVSLLVTTPREIPFSSADTRTFKNTLFHTARLEGRHVLQWSDHRHTYVLVACRTTPVDSLPFAVLTADGS